MIHFKPISITLLNILLLCIIHTGTAQVIGGEYDKLEELYNAGKYEACLLKADNYTYKEENSKDAEPYLYMAMCLFELSKSEDPDIQADYATALKEAVKSAQKFVKKDKKDVLYSQNIEFINTLKQSVFEEVKKLFDAKSYSKAATSAKSYNGLNMVDDPCVTYFVGVCNILSNNMSGGVKNIDDAKIAIKAQTKEKKFKIDKTFKSLSVEGFLKLTEYYVTENNLKSAQTELLLAKELYPDDGYISMQLNMVEKKINGGQ